MDLLTKTGAVKLRSHLNKFLVGDEDTEAVRQTKNGSSKQAIWIVEPCQDKPDAIKLKNLYTGLYLTASDTPFLLGMTGKRVVQLSIFDPTRIEWEPIRDGSQVKFRSTKEGKYLRGNGGMPPWRNSVTHDSPLTGRTFNWVLWDIEPVSEADIGSVLDALSMMSSSNSVLSDELDGSYPTSPMSVISTLTSYSSTLQKRTVMDLFRNAKAVRLKSHHDKYLYADEDEESVSQDRNGSSQNSRWAVELVEDCTIRLKSCYGKYLTATAHLFLLGVTGKKVMQTGLLRHDPAVEWKPFRVGSQVRLQTKDGNYLRGNGGLPPWRNSVTHDLPHRTVTQDWVLWDVDIVEVLDYSAQGPAQLFESDWKTNHRMQEGLVQVEVIKSGSFRSDSFRFRSNRSRRLESSESRKFSLPKPDGRLIYYHIADGSGDVNEATEGSSFLFKGHSVPELTQELKKETGVEDIFVCTRSPLDGKLNPLRLQLPPNSTTMHIIVVPSTSNWLKTFSK